MFGMNVSGFKWVKMLQSDEQGQCRINNGSGGWRCGETALTGSIYCHTHRARRDASNLRSRKYPQKQFRAIALLPSGQLRCRRLGGKEWQCDAEATFGPYCHKHGLQNKYDGRRKGVPKPNPVLNTLLYLTHSPNDAPAPLNKGPMKQTPAAGRKCRRWRCQQITSLGVYCHTHQLDPKNSAAVKPARKATKRFRDKQTISAQKQLDKRTRVHEESGRIGTQETASPDSEPTCESDVENHASASAPAPLDPDASNKGPKKQILVAGRKCRRWRCQEIASPGIYCHTHQLELKSSAAAAAAAVKPARKATKRQGAATKRFRDKQTISAEKQRNKCRRVHEESGRTGTQETASPDSEPTCEPDLENDHDEQNAIDDEQNDAVMLPSLSDYNPYEELQENEGLSFVTDGDMNAINFSCEQMEAEEDITEVLAGAQLTVYVGDILIPAEYKQIYMEIKDLHGPLENGESVCEKKSLSHETLVELLKVAHELGSLTMESMTETTISDFLRTVSIGKLFNYNVGWLDEKLKGLSDAYAKWCAVGEELEQVEKKITEKKHEEVILQLEVDEIDENIQVLEESINKMKQKQETIGMEIKKKHRNVSSLQERILETSERVCDTSREFYRIAAKPW